MYANDIDASLLVVTSALVKNTTATRNFKYMMQLNSLIILISISV